ncbi:MAG: AroM family protein [Candidatus Methylomirabilales bacterium]
METIGILTLGQTPRPDFERIFRRHLPDAKLVVRGGLDGLPDREIDALASAGGAYPLFTILRDGSTREISLHRLVPLLEAQLARVAAEGATVAALMCAGNFPDLAGSVPVLYPGRILPAVVRGVCRGNRIGVVTPNAGQREAATAHWRAKGFDPEVVVAAPTEPDALPRAARALADPALEVIVLDCMGFDPDAARRMRALGGRPVLCPQGLVPRIMAEMLGA